MKWYKNVVRKNIKHKRENKKDGRITEKVSILKKTRGQHFCRVVENTKTQIKNPNQS